MNNHQFSRRQQAGNTKQPCPENSPVNKDIPCDIDTLRISYDGTTIDCTQKRTEQSRLTLKNSPNSDSDKYTEALLYDTSMEVKQVKHGSLEITVINSFGPCRQADHSQFVVIPLNKEAKEILPSKLYHDDRTILKILVEEVDEHHQLAFSQAVKFLDCFDMFNESKNNAKQFEIAVSRCGIRTDGTAGLRHFCALVKIHPSEVYNLTFSLPHGKQRISRRERNLSYEKDGNGRNFKSEKIAVDYRKSKHQKNRLDGELKKDGELKELYEKDAQRIFQSQSSTDGDDFNNQQIFREDLIKFTRNNQPLPIIESLNSILQLLSSLKSFFDNVSSITKKLPKAGVFIEGDMEFLAGSADLTWQLVKSQYSTDSDIFLQPQVKGTINLLIFDVNFTVGVGLVVDASHISSWLNNKAIQANIDVSLSIKFKGSLNLNNSVNYTRGESISTNIQDVIPGCGYTGINGKETQLVSSKGIAEATASGRAVVNLYGIEAGAEATATIKLTVHAKICWPFNIRLRGERSPLRAKFSLKLALIKPYTYIQHIWDEDKNAIPDSYLFDGKSEH